jgi:hypothetical protein
MTDSFSLPEQKATFSQEVAGAVGPQTGLVGGAIKGGLQLRDPSKDQPGAMDALFAFAGKIGDKKFAEWEAKKKDEAFMQGVGRAASGEAAREIEAGQPWYARLFGGGNVVAGARAWEGITDGNQLEASVLERMKDLRELDPAKAQQALLELRQQMKTGDPTRDAAQTAMFVKALPGILKLHAKEHVAFQQEVATEAQRKGIQSAMNGFDSKVQAQNRLDNSDDAALDPARKELAAMFVVPAGVNADTYRLQLVEGMANSMAMGKFGAYTEAKKQGLLADLPKQYARQLEQLHDSEARKVALDRAPKHLKDRLYGMAGMTAAQTEAEIAAINDDFIKSSGLEIPLIPDSKHMTLVQAAARRDEVEAQNALHKAERAEDKAEREQAARDLANRKLAVEIADQQANQRSAEKLVDDMLDSPKPGSVKVAESFNKGNAALKLAQEMLPLAAATRWDTPKLEAGEEEALKQITDPAQAAAQRDALEAKARHKLLSKDGLDLTAARGQIKAALDTGDFEAGKRVIQALAYGAEGEGMKALPATFAKIVPEEHRAMMTAYANEIGAVRGKDGKPPVYDYAALWAAAEAKTKFTSKKPPSAKEIGNIRSAVEAAAKDPWGPGEGETDLRGTQAGALLIDTATRMFDGRVSSDNLTPHGEAIARAREQIQIIPGTGVAYLKNPNATSPISAPAYQDKLPANQRHLLSTEESVGLALKEAAALRGVPLDAHSRVYRADDTPSGAPYFVVLGGPGLAEVINLADLLHASRKLESAKLNVPRGPSVSGTVK